MKTKLLLIAILIISFTAKAQDITINTSMGAGYANQVYWKLDGEIENAKTTTQPTEPTGPRTAEKIYNTYCVACHGTGAAGAPIKGNAEAWGPHIAKGEATLIKHAIEGFNAMPARGTCADCTDEELTDTVCFLIKGM